MRLPDAADPISALMSIASPAGSPPVDAVSSVSTKIFFGGIVKAAVVPSAFTIWLRRKELVPVWPEIGHAPAV